MTGAVLATTRPGALFFIEYGDAGGCFAASLMADLMEARQWRIC